MSEKDAGIAGKMLASAAIIAAMQIRKARP